MAASLLEDAFAHHTWANEELLAFCRGLSDDDLASAASGSYGGVLATLTHLILSDAGYVSRLVGRAPAWLPDAEEPLPVDRLVQYVEEIEGLWNEFLSDPIDPEQVIVVDNGAYEVRAGIFVAQALYHGSAHREQVCAILTGRGIEPPSLQAWEYALASGRLWSRSSDH